jgi:drug/metabolite transporter (DMT)-like permease
VRASRRATPKGHPVSRAVRASGPAHEPPGALWLGLTPGVLGSLLALYLIWGSTYLAIRIAVEGLPPLLMSGFRFLIAGIVLFAFLRLRGVETPPAREWTGAVVMGIFLLLGGNGLVAVAEQHVSSSLTAMVVGTVPLWAALFAGFWGRWPVRLEWFGLLVGFSGVVLLNAQGGLHARPLFAGLIVLSAASWAFGSIWGVRLPLPSGLMASACQMLVGGALLIFAGIARGEHPPRGLPGHSILAMTYLILVGSLIAYSANTYLLRHARPTLATSYAYVNPLVAVLLGVGFAGESIAPLGIAALVVILAGVVIVVLTREGE